MLWWTATARAWTPWLPVNVVVVHHPAGVVLFDTGQHPASLTDPGYYPRGFLGWVYRRQAQFQVAGARPLAEALARHGVDLDHVETVALSHLHQDHAGNLGEVASRRVLVDAVELELLHAKTPEMHGVLRDQIVKPHAGFTAVSYEPLTGTELTPFTQAHDVYGDESLLLLPTPGHSAGSMSILIRRSGSAPVLLVGDATYDVDALRRGVVPGTGATSEQRETTKRINELSERLPDLIIVPAHDPRAAERLNV